MAQHLLDVNSKSLTPREPNLELLDASCERNIIVCLCNTSGKTFIASKLNEYIRHRGNTTEGTITLYVADSSVVISRQASRFRRLTDITVVEYNGEDLYKVRNYFKKSEKDSIFLMETRLAVHLFENECLNMSQIDLLILHGCQCVLERGLIPMKELMRHYYKSHKRPHLLSLASSLFSSELDLSQIESCLRRMEDILDCKAETASNVVSILRYAPTPKEVVLEYGPHCPTPIDKVIEYEIHKAMEFLKDHCYCPEDIYEEFSDELQKIPDPKSEPENVFMELLNVLHTMGPWSADRAALVLLIRTEKLKVTTPYERHFLLLCMTSTVLIKIRAILDDFFKNISEKDRIYKYCSPKVLRLVEILRKFKPTKPEFDPSQIDRTKDSDDEDDDDDNGSEPGSVSREREFVSRCRELLKRKEEESGCDCDLMTEYLVKRVQYSRFNKTTYKEFVDWLKNYKDEEKRTTVSLRRKDLTANQTDKVTGCKENCVDINQIDKSKTINDKVFNSRRRNRNQNYSQSVLTTDDRNPLNNVIQKKNGYLKVSDLSGSATPESRINEVKNLENYIQYHEYLLLPKFRVDKQTRYDRYNSHSRGWSHDDVLLRHMRNVGDSDLCGLIFVESKFTAKVLFHLLSDLRQADEDFSFLNVQFTIGKVVDESLDPKGAETEYRKQELVLKRFRMRICNLLIGTNFLEEGIDLPKCNLVIRFDIPKTYRSYINTKERARAADPWYCFLVDANQRDDFLAMLGEFHEAETMLLKKCGNLEPSEEEEKEADQYTELIQPFCPLSTTNSPHIDLTSAITLVNRYCAKLPSDTFTRLTPKWSLKTVEVSGHKMFVCSIKLPINSPMKQVIEGCPMPTRVLARRFAAFQCCQALHASGELDDTLQPISKEIFWLREEEQLTPSTDDSEEKILKNMTDPRPGSTKRRQYYYKRIADSLTDCLPIAGKPAYLYNISMELTCPLPEEQNTRGRKIHPPEESALGFGIMTRKRIPEFGAFPIFTRSGEVQVKLQLAQSTIALTESQIDKIIAFIQYTFTSVLRLQKYLMMFDPKASENSYFIVPTRKGAEPGSIEVDWNFLDLIYSKKNHVRTFLSEEQRKGFVFDPKKFEDAVVSPWYRNQDQPHYLYVAEICKDLTPRSAFPGTEYTTFEEYYLKKYNIRIQNKDQALLDVDHTSARLNFLTPRYVNRKGVALPTTSEEKKRAKRENLKQKQILIPELCDIHPFPATLWRKAVCLPCILHRINALLLADQMRRIVAREIGVGKVDLGEDYNWKPLDFGWSLADVLKQTKASSKVENEDEDEEVYRYEDGSGKRKQENGLEMVQVKRENEQGEEDKTKEMENGWDEAVKPGPWIEIGTWSNEMANNPPPRPLKLHGMDDNDEDLKEGLNSLPGNITMIDKSAISGTNGWDSNISIDLGSPMSFHPARKWYTGDRDDEFMSDYSSDSSYSADYFDDTSSTDTDSECGGIKIQFTDENVAEAVENQNVTCHLKDLNEVEEDEPWFCEVTEDYVDSVHDFRYNLYRRKEDILKSDKYFDVEKSFDLVRASKPVRDVLTLGNVSTDEVTSFGNPDNRFPRLVDVIPENVKSLPHTSQILKALEVEERRLTEGRDDSNPTAEKRISVNSVMTYLTPDSEDICKSFSFDEQPVLEGHPGPSPSLILQALTMSNANDGINLERLETIGDSFLKYAITTYLYCVYDKVHEGKLSHLRSKQVSNFHLYRLGRRKVLGESMIATKFEPHDNWLPPCYYVPIELERALIEAGIPASHWNRADLPSLKNLSREEICQLVKEKVEKLEAEIAVSKRSSLSPQQDLPSFIPYNLMTQHSIPDKSIADCVEALIGAYLVACGPRGALLFMSWLGIRVLPREEKFFKSEDDPNVMKGIGCTPPVKVVTEEGELWKQEYFGELEPPNEVVFRHVDDPEGELQKLLRGFETFEDSLRYRFRNRSYLLQALTHASYTPNRLTDCYQRLEFLGDAILDYIITRHLYEDSRHHSPGALTDLRSALVNNTIFASLAVRHNFHKYFRHLCPGLNEVIDRFVRFQEEHGHSITQECCLKEEYECEEAEDVEVPKALGDIFESIAGAIFIDSGMSLDAVWRVYYRIMKNEIELFSANVPKSPIRELFELEPETAQFGKPEKLADGRRVRVTVEVFGKGVFNGIGRNHRIAKCTAAKCALKQLKRNSLLERKK